jgi:tRNA A37 methylthiotransferase MiaB
MLKLMHRGYTRERFVDLVGKLRAADSEMGIGTDIIVGFPGETQADFDETLSLCAEVEFDNAFLFKYSQRRDTPAAAMPDQLPESLIEERHARLLEAVDVIRVRKLKEYIGRQMEILVEGPSRRNAARLEGRTRCNKIVVFGNKDEGPVATPGALDAAIIEEGGDDDTPTIGDQGQTAAATLLPHRVFDRVVIGCAIEVSPVVVLQNKTGRFLDGHAPS